MRRLSITLLAACVLPLLAHGQATPSPQPSLSPTRMPMWRCDLPGGSYEVAIHSIISVSTHEYIVDGVARVNELNIDTPGTIEVRFYYIEPLVPNSPLGIGQATLDKLQDLAKEANSQANSDQQQPWAKVVKNYPTTTHAHTVEYRLDSKDQVLTLFNSVEQAFRLNQNTEISLQ